jgi:hypothetical protein
VVARPTSPLPTILPAPNPTDVRPTITAAGRMSLEVVPEGSGLEKTLSYFSETELNFPRIGLRRWIVRSTRRLDATEHTDLVHTELHHVEA